MGGGRIVKGRPIVYRDGFEESPSNDSALQTGVGATMPHRHSDLIEVRQVRGKGRGVFARAPIPKGTVIERVPVIVVPLKEIYNRAPRSTLADYVFKWERDTVMIALGYGSLYNHSYRPNAEFYDEGQLTQVFAAIRDIRRGEEITVNYNGPPRSRGRLDFDVVE